MKELLVKIMSIQDLQTAPGYIRHSFFILHAFTAIIYIFEQRYMKKVYICFTLFIGSCSFDSHWYEQVLL